MAYFPNGTAGEVLDAQCGECPVGRDPHAPCPILLAQMEWNYKQLNKKGEETNVTKLLDMLVNKKGECQMFKVFNEMPYANMDEIFAEFTGVEVQEQKPWYEKYISGG